MATYNTLTGLLKAIADSIRNKKGTTATINAQNFPTEIDGIVLGSGNATTGDVLSGKTFSNDDGAQTGAMANNGAVSKSLGFGESYTVPQGYHNGGGKVSAKAPSGSVSITSNGNHDVTNYATASVNVSRTYNLIQSAQPTNVTESTLTLNSNVTDGILVIGAWKEGYNYSMYAYASVNSGTASLTKLKDISNGYPNTTRGGMTCYRFSGKVGAVLRLWATGTQNSSSADTGGCGFVCYILGV